MPRRGERDFVRAKVPDNPIPGLIAGLIVLAVAGSFGVALLHSGLIFGLIFALIGGTTQTLTSLNRLSAFLRYERRYEPDPALRPGHRVAACIVGVLVAIIIGEVLRFVLAHR